MRDNKIKTPLNLLTASLLGVSAPSFAAVEHFELEEIVVTAQKREQSLQDIAMSVSAISEDALFNSGIDTAEDLKAIIPGLNIYSGNSPAATGIQLRGAGTGAADPTLEPSVGFFVDGVFMPRSLFGISDLVDVSQVEVLFGPQGTLYGKNTNAGVISVTTKKPSESFEALFEQTLGNDGLTDTKLALSDTINDELAYRVSSRLRKRDGVMGGEFDNSEYNQVDKQSYRGLLEWTAAENTLVRFSGYYSLEDSYGSSPDSYLDPTSNLSVLAQTLNGGVVENTDIDDREITNTFSKQNRVEVKGASVQVEHDFENVTFLSSTGWQQWDMESESDVDMTSIDIVKTTDRMQEDSFSQEFRLTSPGGETIDWVAGLFYFKSDLQRGDKDKTYAEIGDGFAPFAGAAAAILGGLDCTNPVNAATCGAGSAYLAFTPGASSTWEANYETESVAVFGQATYNFSEATNLTLGLRYGTEEKDFDFFTDTNLSGNPAQDIFIRALTGPNSGADSISDDGFNGMISLNHFVGDAMFYATVATGNKSGGFNGDAGLTPIDDREYDTEKTLSYEVGAKIDNLLDGRARINLAYYYTEYKDFQVTQFDVATVAFLVENAGRQVTQGIDIDAMVAVTPNLTMGAKISYLDARFRDYKEAGCHTDAAAPHNPDGTCDFSGKQMPFAPYWSGTVSADYVYPLSNGEMYFHSDIAYRGEHVADPTFAPYGTVDATTLVNVRMGWRADHWDLSLWGKNVTDETYSVNHTGHTIAQALGGGTQSSYWSWLNQPASYGATLRYSY
ncbi:TonB-dependent receptor [Maricurvus nonylphenolicus]|uniref:TonB-dependent receptor n=1 Tax=Maricurvus nonylphenolicus TaxID=1008307 RepID=UPI0036F3A9F7